MICQYHGLPGERFTIMHPDFKDFLFNSCPIFCAINSQCVFVLFANFINSRILQLCWRSSVYVSFWIQDTFNQRFGYEPFIRLIFTFDTIFFTNQNFDKYTIQVMKLIVLSQFQENINFCRTLVQHLFEIRSTRYGQLLTYACNVNIVSAHPYPRQMNI